MAGAIDWDQVDPHVREEYQRLRASGHPEGSATLSRASKASLASDALAAAGPEGTAAAAVLKAGSVARGSGGAQKKPSPSSASAVGRYLGRPLGATPRAVATSIPGDNALARLILAAFAGILALEVVSQVTGGYFSWDVKSPLKPGGDLTYRPLYRGQEVNQVHSAPGGAPFVPNNPQVTHGQLPV